MIGSSVVSTCASAAASAEVTVSDAPTRPMVTPTMSERIVCGVPLRVSDAVSADVLDRDRAHRHVLDGRAGRRGGLQCLREQVLETVDDPGVAVQLELGLEVGGGRVDVDVAVHRRPVPGELPRPLPHEAVANSGDELLAPGDPARELLDLVAA